jgi:transcriptional regulator of acetoin/glycerol metabolism
MVYRELGLEPPSPGSPVRAGAATAEDVRHALRHLHQPVELAGSPLAGGSGTAERAASVRVLLEDALARAFGDSPAERLLHDIARRAYFEPQGSHETAAHELHVSRATYFRRLRQATERMADYLDN